MPMDPIAFIKQWDTGSSETTYEDDRPITKWLTEDSPNGRLEIGDVEFRDHQGVGRLSSIKANPNHPFVTAFSEMGDDAFFKTADCMDAGVIRLYLYNKYGATFDALNPPERNALGDVIGPGHGGRISADALEQTPLQTAMARLHDAMGNSPRDFVLLGRAVSEVFPSVAKNDEFTLGCVYRSALTSPSVSPADGNRIETGSFDPLRLSPAPNQPLDGAFQTRPRRA